jgi:hypothetical protein
MPERALALLNQSGYSRLIQEAERIARAAARKGATASAVGAAATAAGGPVGTLARVVTGPTGWALYGVASGLLLWYQYYTQQQIEAIKNRAGQGIGDGSVEGTTISVPPGAYCYTLTGSTQCQITVNGNTLTKPFGFDAMISVTETGSGCSVLRTFGSGVTNQWQIVSGGQILQQDNAPSGPSSNDVWSCVYAHLATDDAYDFMPGTGEPTAQQVADFVETLPASDPDSVESHTQPGGTNNPAPVTQGTVQTTTTTVSPTEVTTEVKPTTQVTQGDVVVKDNVPPPAGTEQTNTATQTTTSVTTANPDGSTTHEETATTSCSTQGHDERTMGSVLQEHQAKWNNAPLVAALNTLKTLAWPSTLPVVSFSSSLLGSFQVDFNAWSWVFLALKTLILAGASLAAYRIVFVGGR